MKEETSNGLLDRLDQEVSGRKRVFLVAAVISVLILIASLPFLNWIRIDAAGVYEALGLKETAEIASGYTVYNLLGFVGESGVGSIGMTAMLLLIWMVAAVVLHLRFVIKLALNREDVRGILPMFVSALSAMFFTVFMSIALIAYTIFANKQIGANVMSLSPIVYILPILALAAFICLKALEKREMARCREHGFVVEFKRNWVLFLMLVPTVIFFMINSFLPMIGGYWAFTNFNFRDGLWASPFYGFKNFEYLWKGDLVRLIRNTVLYNLVFILVGNVLQIFFAILVSRVTVTWFKKASQTLMFMPYFVSFVILNVLVYNLFEYNYGLVNNVVTSLGGSKIDFYNTPRYWPGLITFFYIWKNIGYGMVVYLATIMGIDTELYEAARVDGANVFQQIKSITLPLLKPTFIILLLYSLGSIMKGQFELFYQMVGTNGLLYKVTDIFDTYVYRITTTQPMSIGPGTAAGLFQSVFGFILVMVVNWVVKRRNSEYALF